MEYAGELSSGLNLQAQATGLQKGLLLGLWLPLNGLSADFVTDSISHTKDLITFTLTL